MEPSQSARQQATFKHPNKREVRALAAQTAKGHNKAYACDKDIKAEELQAGELPLVKDEAHPGEVHHPPHQAR